jgi:hypothetical protein
MALRICRDTIVANLDGCNHVLSGLSPQPDRSSVPIDVPGGAQSGAGTRCVYASSCLVRRQSSR